MIWLKKHYGAVLLAGVTLLPILLWLASADIDRITSTNGRIIAAFGKAAAFSGLALYAVMPILSMRHKLIELLFGGLDKVYRLHNKSGKIAFYIILLHPILLAVGRLVGGRSITNLWNWTSLLILSGLIALAILICVTAMSIYAHIKHQSWIIIHRLFGWLIVLFYYHALVAGSQLIQNRLLFWYMLIIGIIGFTAFLYRSVFSTWLIRKYRYEVTETNHMSENVIELVLKPKGVPMSYQAGQFAYVSFKSIGIDHEAHPYSFSNANNGPYVRFTIKALGDDTKQLQHIKAGTPAHIEGPYGTFSYKRVRNHKQVWIAGGIGITPFLSMARSFSGKQKYDIRFFYGSETLEEAVFLQEFIDISRHVPENFNVKVVARNYTGFVSAELLKHSLENLAEFDYLICGPPGMMKALKSQLLAAGVTEEHIHMEAFSM